MKHMHGRKLAIKCLPGFLHITYKLLLKLIKMKQRYWFVQSMFWGLSKGTAGGMLLDAPFSAGGGTPHLPSDSRGSKT